MLTFITRIVGFPHGRNGAPVDGASPPRPLCRVPLRSSRRTIDLRVGGPFDVSGLGFRPERLGLIAPAGRWPGRPASGVSGCSRIDDANGHPLPDPRSCMRRRRPPPPPHPAGDSRRCRFPDGAARLCGAGTRGKARIRQGTGRGGPPATRLKPRRPSDGALGRHRSRLPGRRRCRRGHEPYRPQIPLWA
jgi:hypothetical protein